MICYDPRSFHEFFLIGFARIFSGKNSWSTAAYGSESKKKSCENLVRCWSTEDEIVTLIKVNDYGYEGGFSLLCSGANDHIFSRQKVEWNECLSWFLCFNSYLMSYLIDNSRLDLIPKNSWIFWHLLNDKSKNRFEFLRSVSRCHWPPIFLAENPVRFDWIRNGRRFLCSAAVLQGQLNFKQGRCYHY